MSQFMCPRVSVTPWCRRNVSATNRRPCSSKPKATGFATSGSAAYSSSLSPEGTRTDLIARSGSAEAATTGGLYGWADSG
ncbi:MAG TPA: hypothetical protein VG406_00870, partial [Isosphaeraceae bacterium]|nr:hypothetical protein [Isosphaeraceae bacterium]